MFNLKGNNGIARIHGQVLNYLTEGELNTLSFWSVANGRVIRLRDLLLFSFVMSVCLCRSVFLTRTLDTISFRSSFSVSVLINYFKFESRFWFFFFIFLIFTFNFDVLRFLIFTFVFSFSLSFSSVYSLLFKLPLNSFCTRLKIEKLY